MAAAAGDAGAQAVLGELGWWLALGLANLAYVLDPAVMVVGGGLVEPVTLVLEPVRSAFDELVEGRATGPRCMIVPAVARRAGRRDRGRARGAGR